MMMEEMNHVMKRMLAQCAGSTGALLISYLLSRYLFFDLHGMKSFPFYLLCAGVAVSAVAAFFHAGILSAAAAVGYIAVWRSAAWEPIRAAAAPAADG